MQDLMNRAKYLCYGCGYDKKQALEKAKSEFSFNGTERNLTDIRMMFDITVDEYLESEM